MGGARSLGWDGPGLKWVVLGNICPSWYEAHFVGISHSKLGVGLRSEDICGFF